MRKSIWRWAIFLNVTGMAFSYSGCHDDKPIVAPNPKAADCIVDRTKAELDCVKDKPSEAEAQACIADVKKKQNCVDGGK